MTPLICRMIDELTDGKNARLKADLIINNDYYQ